MRFVVQRVSEASVQIGEETVGAIGKGLMVLVGVSDTDDEGVADRMLRKLLSLRIFEDAEGKTNLDLKSVEGNLLLVSQFTLYANCKKGNRPSFIEAGEPAKAEALYTYLLKRCREEFPDVQQGRFGADMKVNIVNDGPFTILLDSDTLLG